VGDPWTPPPGWGEPETRTPHTRSANPPDSRIVIPVVTGAVGLLLGAAAVAAGGTDTTTAEEAAAQPQPTVTVTVTATPAAAPEPATTVTVTATPAATPRPVAKPAPPTPKPKPTRTATRAPEPPASAFYENCAAARAAGAAPLYAGEPGYRSGLDRDHDGVACE
jgi:outer membrane biosynthesis protein TonB